MHDEEYLRERLDRLEDTLDSLAEPDDGSLSDIVVTATVSSYPTSANSFYAVQPLSVDGVETEGGSASFTSSTDVFYAYNLGSSVPPVGTKLIVSSVSGRWTFIYNGDGS